MPVWISLGVVAGLIAGSFLATLVMRWPQQRDMGGRSSCDSCGRELAWHDLIPLVSFAIQRGKCAACGARIDPLHTVIELLCAVAGGVAMAVAPGPIGAAGALFAWLLVTLAALDLRHFWLPDRLVFVLGALGLGAGFVDDLITMLDRVIGGVTGYAALTLIATAYRLVRKREGLGGGDPKLFGAIGLWLGWQYLPFVLLGASGAGLLAVAVLMLRGRTVSATMRLPFGTLLAVAAFPVWMFMR